MRKDTGGSVLPFRLALVLGPGGPAREIVEELWQAPASRTERGAEQDRAAGGRGRRLVQFGDGRTAHGSVWFKRANGYVYAYLRYTAGGRTQAEYVGPVDAGSREEGLRQAWARVHAKELPA